MRYNENTGYPEFTLGDEAAAEENLILFKDVNIGGSFYVFGDKTQEKYIKVKVYKAEYDFNWATKLSNGLIYEFDDYSEICPIKEENK